MRERGDNYIMIKIKIPLACSSAGVK